VKSPRGNQVALALSDRKQLRACSYLIVKLRLQDLSHVLHTFFSFRTVHLVDSPQEKAVAPPNHLPSLVRTLWGAGTPSQGQRVETQNDKVLASISRISLVEYRYSTGTGYQCRASRCHKSMDTDEGGFHRASGD
jgi:hypothetical protein